MTFATERELQLTREVLQLRLALIERESVIGRMQHERFKAELAALPEKWEPQPTKLEAVA